MDSARAAPRNRVKCICLTSEFMDRTLTAPMQAARTQSELHASNRPLKKSADEAVRI
jgi:hypothetical protein